MKVYISAVTFDLLGSVGLDPLPNSNYGALIRRANKVKTLDGGVAVTDFGFTHADREFNIELKPTRAIDTSLRYIVENHSLVHVSTDEGYFKAIPQYAVSNGIATLSLSVTEQLA
jgi:hypothetical protein